MFYVLPCVILFLCFIVLLALRLPRLGKRELVLVLFIRLFNLCLFGLVGFLFLLVSGRGCDCDCGTLWTFLLPFSIAFILLGEERDNLSAFRTFVQFVLVWIGRFPLPLGVWEGLRFVIVALPGLFSYFFFFFTMGGK